MTQIRVANVATSVRQRLLIDVPAQAQITQLLPEGSFYLFRCLLSCVIIQFRTLDAIKYN